MHKADEAEDYFNEAVVFLVLRIQVYGAGYARACKSPRLYFSTQLPDAVTQIVGVNKLSCSHCTPV